MYKCSKFFWDIVTKHWLSQLLWGSFFAKVASPLDHASPLVPLPYAAASEALIVLFFTSSKVISMFAWSHCLLSLPALITYPHESLVKIHKVASCTSYLFLRFSCIPSPPFPIPKKKKRFIILWVPIVVGYYYASLSSGEAYRDRQLTTNFELWVFFFVLTCFHVRIPIPCLSVCLPVCPYPEKRNHHSFVNISPSLVIDVSIERS